ncbi:MAG TPA: radical SAM protein [Longimicrobium sp.]|nr:radical SAM protein [Longimicrobium sp.]
MFVQPFWSYREADGGYLLVNHLTRRSAAFPAAVLDALEHAFEARPPAGDGEASLLAGAAELDLVFPSEAAGTAWLDAHERGWQRELPLVDQIELTNRCPYSCRMCPRTYAMDRALGDMPLELFERILEQLGGEQDYVALHHFGESLLHRELPAAVAAARSRGVRTGLSCNPPTLRPELAHRLLDAGIANLVLSLDSLDPDTYRDIRGRSARFDRADTHVRALVQLRDAGEYDAWITLQMINMRCNAREADEFLAYCREVGVDRGVVVRMGRWDFDDDRVSELGEFTSPGYDGYCSRPWTSVVVLWDGRVVPCCHDYNGATVLGDLRTQTLREIWESEPVARFRDQNGSYEMCRRCAFSRWAREEQRRGEGFRAFHRSRGTRARREWLNPASVGRRNGRDLFDGFDVLEA